MERENKRLKKQVSRFETVESASFVLVPHDGCKEAGTGTPPAPAPACELLM